LQFFLLSFADFSATAVNINGENSFIKLPTFFAPYNPYFYIFVNLDKVLRIIEILAVAIWTNYWETTTIAIHIIHHLVLFFKTIRINLTARYGQSF
jgi:hypothetical protein